MKRAEVTLLVVAAAVVAALGTSDVEPSLESNALGSLEAMQPPHQHGELWAVLVAGSNSWMNYRHQADVCHAYQILHQHGVPDNHIIVMMYDDLANNKNNPTPGVVINRPGGPNVYEGVPKDYIGRNVTPENFLKVLRGDTEGLRGIGSERVLKSGPNDRVFINLVDHGGPGIFAFPDDYLSATDLADTLIDMHNNRRYNKLVIYVESCESGSLFKKLLPNDIEVYALSASGPNQSSYACYFDEELNTFLGDVFSVKWMEDTDREDLHQESLDAQFLLVRQEVSTSTVMHWGELKLANQKLSQFLGGKRPHSQTRLTPPVQFSDDDPCVSSSVPSPNVPVAILKARKHAAHTISEKQHWQEQLDILQHKRTILKLVMWHLVKEVTGNESNVSLMVNAQHVHDIVRWPCYLDSVRIIHSHCLNLAQNPYMLQQLHILVNLCEHGYTPDDVMRATASMCPFALKDVL